MFFFITLLPNVGVFIRCLRDMFVLVYIYGCDDMQALFSESWRQQFVRNIGLIEREQAMNRETFEAAMNAPPIDTSGRGLMKRFEFAFSQTQDIALAMAAVNELLDTPLTYQQFLAAIRK